MCEPGYYLIPDEGYCVSSCPVDSTSTTPLWYADSDHRICRKWCPAGTFYDENDPLNCLECDDENYGIRHCEQCSYFSGVGSTLMCNDCAGPLEPTDNRQQCEHKWCKSINATDPFDCILCMDNFYKDVETTRCRDDCWNYEKDVQYQKDQFTPRTCGRVCESHEFLDITDKRCKECSDHIDSCSECHQTNDFNTVCTACSDGLFPTWDGMACQECPTDEFMNEEGECQRCSDFFHNCGGCELDEEGDVQCLDCLGESTFRFNEEGEAFECACEFVEYLYYPDPSTRLTGQCVPCVDVVDDCNACSQVDTWHSAHQMWTTDVNCDECRIPQFVDEFGECTYEPCRQWNEEDECLECNTKINFMMYPQESTCVPACTYPYTLLDDLTCGITCEDGSFRNGTRCIECNTPGCQICIAEDECTKCYDELSEHFDASCTLSCPAVSIPRDINIPVADYTPFIGGARCVSEETCLSSSRNVLSGGETTGMDLQCRHCGEGCVNCIEDANGLLQCLECETGLFRLGDKCVESCPDTPCWSSVGNLCQRQANCNDWP